MGIFLKISQTEVEEPIEQGEWAMPFDEFDPDYLKDFHDMHRVNVDARFDPKKKTSDPWNITDDPRDISQEGSYILHPNGAIDFLPEHHWNHLSNVQERIYDRLPPDAQKRYMDNFARVSGVAQGIHSLFKGGIRLYVSEYSPGDKSVTITARQLPSLTQISALDTFMAAQRPTKINFEARIIQNGQNKNIDFYTDSWEDVKQFISSNRLMNQAPTPEVLQRIQTIKNFRSPFYGENFKEKIPPKSVFPTVKGPIKPDLNVKTPATLRYPGAAQLHNLIKIAEELDECGKYQESDEIDKLIRDMFIQRIPA